MPKDSNPLVSLIVPTFNRVDQLEVTIAGIAAQTYENLELVIVDDGSEEHLVDRIEELTAPFTFAVRTLRLHRSNPDGNGPAFVRNQGVAISTGSLVAFCDDDDYWCDPDHLRVAVQRFEEDPELDYFFANQRACREGTTAYNDWLPSLTTRIASRSPFADRCYDIKRHDILAEGHFPHLNTTVVRRELFDDIEGFRNDLRYSEDLDFFVRATDVARKIVFRNDIVSVHNIPNPTIASHASTRLTWRQRRLVVAAIADYLRLYCSSKEAQAYASRIEGVAYRDLSTALASEREWTKAHQFAKLACALLPTWRWRGYTAILGIRRRLS